MSRRLQLALNVNDIDEAVAFYTRLFGTEPAKRRPGYANFAIAEPPLKLVLLENPGQGGSLNHLGVEVARHRHRRVRAGPPGRGRARRGRGARHHLLLRQAGQVLGPGRPRRRVLGDLHGAGRQPDLLRPRATAAEPAAAPAATPGGWPVAGRLLLADGLAPRRPYVVGPAVRPPGPSALTAAQRVSPPGSDAESGH